MEYPLADAVYTIFCDIKASFSIDCDKRLRFSLYGLSIQFHIDRITITISPKNKQTYCFQLTLTGQIHFLGGLHEADDNKFFDKEEQYYQATIIPSGLGSIQSHTSLYTT